MPRLGAAHEVDRSCADRQTDAISDDCPQHRNPRDGASEQPRLDVDANNQRAAFDQRPRRQSRSGADVDNDQIGDRSERIKDGTGIGGAPGVVLLGHVGEQRHSDKVSDLPLPRTGGDLVGGSGIRRWYRT